MKSVHLSLGWYNMIWNTQGQTFSVLVSKGSGNSVITPASCPPSTTNFSQFQHHLTEISGVLLFTHIWKPACDHRKTPGLLSWREVKNSVTSRYSHKRVDFWVFWVLQFRVTCFLNEHWKPVVQHKPFKKQQRWRSYCMNIATQDHLASKTFYCFETVHKVIKNSNGLCQKSIQRRRGKGRTEKEQWK